MNSDKSMSLVDPDQAVRYVFDDKLKANRVVIVGSDNQDITDSIKEAVKLGLKDIKIDLTNNKEPQVTERIIEKLVEIPKIEYVEKIVVVEKPTDIKIVEIPQKPIIVHNTEVIQVEKPIYIDRFNDREVIKYVQKSTFEKIISVLQITLMAAIVAIQLFKK